MKKSVKQILSISILLIILAFAAYYIYKNIDSFKELTIVSPHFIVILVIIFLLSYVTITYQTIVILNPFKIKLGFFEGFQLSIITGFYNLITPFRGGMATRAIYLKKKYEFPYTAFLATLSASYIVLFFIFAFFGLVSTYLLYLRVGPFNPIIPLIFLGTFLSMLFIMVFSPRIKETKSNWLNRFINVINGWHLIKNNFRTIFMTSIMGILQILIGAFALQIQFSVFGIPLDFVSAMFLTSIGGISIIIAITPANLGVGEVIGVFSALTIGITPTQSLSAAILGRAVQFIVMFILGPIFSYLLLKKKN
ncbi:MAG: lysylphosphatidylglycerol synthase transmembrane domain-containing protein [Nanoarchaeota archaeon]